MNAWREEARHQRATRTDYFLTGVTARYDDWEPTGNSIDCKTASTCNNVKASVEQDCTTNKWEVGGAISPKLEAKILETVTIGAGIEVKASGGRDKQVCAATHSLRLVHRGVGIETWWV